MREAQSTLEERLDTVRDGVQARVGIVRDAVESGRRAAQEARSDLETRLERSKAAARAGIAAAKEAADGDGDGDEDEDEDGPSEEGAGK